MKPQGFIVGLILFSLCTVNHGFSQGVMHKRDSVDVLLSASNNMLKSNPEQSVSYARKAMAMAEKIGYQKGMAEATLMLANSYYYSADAEQALKYSAKAASDFLSLGDSTMSARAHNVAGGVYNLILSDYAMAMSEYTSAYHLAKNDSIFLMRSIGNIASVYQNINKLDTSLYLKLKVYHFARRHRLDELTSIVINNIGALYSLKKEYRSALEYYQKSLTYDKMLNDTASVNFNHTLLNIGNCYINLKEYQKANDILEDALTLAKRKKFLEREIRSLVYLGRLKYEQKYYDEAERFFKEAEHKSSLYKINQHQIFIYDNLAQIAAATGNAQQEALYLKKNKLLSDSVSQVEAERAANSLAARKTTPTQPVGDNGTSFSRYLPYSLGIITTAGLGLFLYLRHRNNRTEIIPERVGATSHPVAQAVQSASTYVETLDDQGVKLVKLETIKWFEKSGRMYYAISDDVRLRVKATLDELEAKLPPDRFFRINRNAIINMNYMTNYSFWENHKYIIRMNSALKTEFVITRNRLKEMKEKFNVEKL